MRGHGQGSRDDKQENKRENNKRKMSGPHETEGGELVVSNKIIQNGERCDIHLSVHIHSWDPSLFARLLPLSLNLLLIICEVPRFVCWRFIAFTNQHTQCTAR